MSAVAVRPITQNEQWQRIFTVEAIKNSTQSLNFMKKLTMIGMSNIALVRDIFPRQSFEYFQLENLKISILKERSQCPQACQLFKWIKASYDAIDKQYLKQLVLCIYKNENDFDSLIESYSFKYKYNLEKENHDPTIRGNSEMETIKKSTCYMLNSIIRLRDIYINKLPDHYFLGIQLYYFDDAPSDYQPEGFARCYDQKKYESFIIFGQVNTPFHKVLLKGYLDRRRENALVENTREHEEQALMDDISRMNIQEKNNEIDAASNEEIEDNREPEAMDHEEAASNEEIEYNIEPEVMDHDEADFTQNEETNMSLEEGIEVINETRVQREPSAEINSSKLLTSQKEGRLNSSQLSEKGNLFRGFELPPKKDLPPSFTAISEHSSEYEIRCPCDKTNDLDQYMLKCMSCQTWQHAACFGLIHRHKPNENHICDICNLNSPSSPCTDPYLLQLDSRQKQRLCEFRLALIHCLNFGSINASVFVSDFLMSKTSAIKLMSRLEKKDVFMFQSTIKPSSFTQIRKIDIHFLRTNLISKYFQENFENVEDELEASKAVDKEKAELVHKTTKREQKKAQRMSNRQVQDKTNVEEDENYNNSLLNKENTDKRTSLRLKHSRLKYTHDDDDDEVAKKKSKKSNVNKKK